MHNSYRIRNNQNLEIEITNYGARIIRLIYEGTDLVMGFDNISDYYPENNPSDFGAVIGRYANRIANGKFVIDNKTIQLPINNGKNCLHGGPMGWQYSTYEVIESNEQMIKMKMTSKDGDNGFPGEVTVEVTYSVDNDNSLRIDYHAQTNKTTIINMTNHSYFNLDGVDTQPETSLIHDHILQIDADQFTPVDKSLIPLGEHRTVEESPFDFRKAKPIGQDIGHPHEQLNIGNGYDHNFVLNTKGDINRPCARLNSQKSGIKMEIYTTAPGIQLYTGNFLNGIKGKNQISYPMRGAVCLETQQYPDSPNHNWPESSGYLYPGKPYHSTTIFKFQKNDRH